MSEKLQSIKNMGFARAGSWKLLDGRPDYDLNDLATMQNILLALVVNDDVVYIGKTVKTLQAALQRYKTPPKTDKNGAFTNIRNNKNICDSLREGKNVEVFVLQDNDQKDRLIRDLNPDWNRR